MRNLCFYPQTDLFRISSYLFSPQVEVVTGTRKFLDGSNSEPKRRSKWDQVGAPQGSSIPIIKPAGLATGLPPPSKTSIPAFGSIAKKK